MKKIIFLTGIFIFFFAGYLHAQTSLKAEVDKTKITTDEAIIYRLIIASTEKKIPAPVLPKFEGFKVLSQAQSSTVSLIKGLNKTVVVYAYVLAPKEKGKFEIEPSTVKIKDSLISSEGFEIEVSQGKLKPLPEKIQPQSDQPQLTL